MPCSICKQPGHNRRSCPHANTFVSNDKDCCVCMSPIKTTNRCTTKCGHNFCLSCFFECVKHKPECPICRTKFNYSISGEIDKLKREYAELAEWTDELAYYDSRNCKKIRALEKTNAELEKTQLLLRQRQNNLEGAIDEIVCENETLEKAVGEKCNDNARLYAENDRLNKKIIFCLNDGKKIRALEETNAELEKTNAELYQKIKWYNMQLGNKHKIEKIVNDFQSTYKKLKQEMYST